MVKFMSQFLAILYLSIILCFSNSLKAMETIISVEKNVELTDAILPRTDPKKIGILYQILKVLDFELNQNNIRYWMDFGTLLGACRHGGIVPWDDDADICIEEINRDKLLAMAPLFENYGLQLTVFYPSCLYKIHRKGNIIPFVDVFFMYYDADRKQYRPRNCFETCTWNQDELFPLKTMQLGPLTLKVPHQGIQRHLDFFYGPNWINTAIFWNHSNNGPPHGTTVKIVDFSPAAYEVTEDIIDLD